MTARILWRFVERSGLRAECGELVGWLSEAEQCRLAEIRHPARREASALARVAVKQLVQAECSIDLDPQAMELVSQDRQGRGVRPKLTIAGRTLPWSVSISHTETAILVAMATQPGLSVGIDLVGEHEADGRALQTWFEPSEHELVSIGDSGEALRLWAIKEAVYKAANQDDPFAPRRVCIRRTPDSCYQATYRGLDLASCCRIEPLMLPGHIAALVQVAAWGTDFCPLVERDSSTLAHSSHF